MSEHTQKEPRADAMHAGRKLSCEDWEALLVDFLDGTLLAGDLEAFHSHQRSCASCAEMFPQAGQGREWLNFLRTEPEVPSTLISKILAQTSGTSVVPAIGNELAAPVSPIAIPIAPVLPLWKRASVRAAQPRLMMTAAMAFFSITLTLNMAGVRLSAVRLADLKPASLSYNLNKQYHMATARVHRYYYNLRFVYEMEARVRELRHDADLENSTPTDKPAQPSTTNPPTDGNHKSGGQSEGPIHPQPQALPWGEKIVATLNSPFTEAHNSRGTYASCFPGQAENREDNSADQAERGIA